MVTQRRQLHRGGGPRAHAVYELERDLLLVFKPRGHREALHTHEYGQRLTLVRGELQVRTRNRARSLSAPQSSLTIPAGRPHETLANRHTWLLVQRIKGSARD